MVQHLLDKTTPGFVIIGLNLFSSGFLEKVMYSSVFFGRTFDGLALLGETFLVGHI
jgi:hypothetical protein